ncbi:MAG: hypothetical protein H7Z38_08870 [Rubrivivax sp.]|nr:hypothetical protein [Pyrinomonadaceae bacterium]
MNGLELITPDAPSLLDRLLRRPQPRSFPIEVNNYVAATPLSEVTRDAVERIISDCGRAGSGVKDDCALVYSRVLGHLALDGKITDEELEQLQRLRGALGLSTEDVREAEARSLLPLYRERLKESLADRHLTQGEDERLKSLARDLGLDDAQTDDMVLNETFRAFEQSTQRTVFTSVEDALEYAQEQNEADDTKDL